MEFCRIADLKYKEVINLSDGARLGYANDIEFDTETGKVSALVVPGPARFFGLFGRKDDVIVKWDSITRIGEDIILIEQAEEIKHIRAKGKTHAGLFD